MIRINQLKLLPEATVSPSELDRELKTKIKKALRLKGEPFSYSIVRKSVDSRYKPEIFIVYSVDVQLADERLESKILKTVHDNNIMLSKRAVYSSPEPIRQKNRPAPVIAGFGPAGMFCALMLARAGYKPIVLERGEPVEQRVKTVNEFWNGGRFKPDSNAQFGEGGAGTFSDGKLNTQVKEVYGRIGKVLDIFVEHGADISITYEAKPHIGTDRLVDIVRSIRHEIISLGGQVLFSTKLTNVELTGSRLSGVYIKKEDETKEQFLNCDTLVLSIGHSARDTFYALKSKLTMEQKAFAVGLRIEHPQELINIHEFGDGKYKDYMPASYKLTHKASNGRGVYSFCMCPGGYVVNASSEEGRLAVNGMSYSGRDGSNANSALIVTVDKDDFGSEDSLAGIEFQRKLEEAAYRLCDGDIPVQRYEDFKNNKATTLAGLESNSIHPQIKGAYRAANLRSILPQQIADSLVEGVDSFERQIPGYAASDALFSGIESRTSSPVRIVRDDTLQAVGIHGIYPCGEGAGYAGGITSAAVDGIKVYEAVISTE